MLSYWMSIISTDCRKLPRKVYSLARKHGLGQWCLSIRKLCVRYSMLNLWNVDSTDSGKLQSVINQMKDKVCTHVI